MPSISFTITRDDKEIEVDVTYTSHPGCRGHRDKYGAPEEPDEDDWIEILEAIDEAGTCYELTTNEEQEIEEKITKG